MGVHPPIAVREINPTTPAIAPSLPPSPIFSAQIRRYSAIPQGTATARVQDQAPPPAAAVTNCFALLPGSVLNQRPVPSFFFFACPCPCLPPLALGPWSCHVPLPGPSHHARSRSGQRWRSKQASHVGKCNDFVNILISFFFAAALPRETVRERGIGSHLYTHHHHRICDRLPALPCLPLVVSLIPQAKKKTPVPMHACLSLRYIPARK